MYKYAKEKLTEDLNEKQNIKQQIIQELNEVTDKLDCIKSDGELADSMSKTGGIALTTLIFCVPLAPISIWVIWIAKNTEIILFGILMGVIGIAALVCEIYEIKSLSNDAKKRKLLKIKGLKEFIKQREYLQEKELELQEKRDNIQSDINEITTNLEHINFIENSANDFFYQADTEEEYATQYIYKCEQLLDEYLNEKADYGNIHLVPSSKDIDSPKLIKKI